MFAMQFLVPLYLRDMLGYDAIQIGLAFVPLPLAIAVMSLGVTGRLIGRYGTTRTLLPGVGLLALGLALLASTPLRGIYLRDVLPAMLVLGLGAGLVIPALMATAMADAAPTEAGLASGLANTTIQVGGALGLAALVTLASERTATLRGHGQAIGSALLGGYHLGFEVASGLAGAALLLALALLWRPAGRVRPELADAHAGS
jgi:MFS family permease